MRTLSALAIASVVLTLAARASAQECGCDHEILPGTGEVNGTDLGFLPGDVVCVMAGQYEFIRFREIHGTLDAPIVIQNCGGVVEVRNLDRAYAVDFQGSSHHFRFTGTGDPASAFGFRVSAPDVDPYPGIPLWFLDKSTDYEADHVEVYEAGFAGVMAKTDPLCDGSADQDVFVQTNVRLHHLWVHDTGGEGFYVGSTQSNGQMITCNGSQELHQPHFLEGIQLDHNLVHDTQWDGAQVGMAHVGCGVTDNVIQRVGLGGVEYQQQGLQIGTYSRCDVRRNTLTDGPTNGIFVLGAYDTTVADNVVARFLGDAVYMNANMIPGPVSYRLVHNTLLGFGDSAAHVFGDQVEGAVSWNNLVIGPPTAISAGGDVGFAEEGNLFLATEAEAGFVDAAADDYHLTEGSAARAAGIDHAADGFDLDHDGLLRAAPPSIGAFEYVPDSPTGGGGGAGASPPLGGNAGQGGNGNPGANGSCGCSVPGAERRSVAPLLALAILVARARRRSRS